jgi:hypothetical protein
MGSPTLPHLISATLALSVVVSCKKKDEEAPPAQGGYSQPAYTGTATQPPPAQPTATATSSPANSMALPCQTDATCITHRCNTTAGRCAWPCQTNDDCTAGNTCMAPMCVPGGAVQPQPQ